MLRSKKIMSIAMVGLMATASCLGAASAYAEDTEKDPGQIAEKQPSEEVGTSFEEQKAYAAVLGVDTTGMTTVNQIREAIRSFKEDGGLISAKSSRGIADIAAQQGINTVGMTDEQIGSAVKNNVLLEQAAAYGIDTANMTDDQIKVAMESQYFEEQKAYAAVLGVDTTGMTTGNQIREAIRAFKAAGWSKPQ